MAVDNKSTFPFLQDWLELNQMVKDKEKLKELGIDQVTGLPTVPLLLDEIKQRLQEQKQVALICIDVVRYSKIEEIYGWEAYDNLMRAIAKTIMDLCGSYLRDTDIVSRIMVSGNAFVILVAPPRKKAYLEESDLKQLTEKVGSFLETELRKRLKPSLYEKFGCYVGGSLLKEGGGVGVERLVYRCLEEALKEAEEAQLHDVEKRALALEKIIESESIKAIYHPIVDISERKVVGYEALCRGPENTEFEMPTKLFRVAYEANLVLKLECLCRQKALEGARGLPSSSLLFLNVESESVEDPYLRQIISTNILEPLKLSTDQIVLEVTEQTAVTNFNEFKNAFGYFKELGFKMSIDDAGAGYTSLQCVAELIPDFIKLDMSLIRSVDKDAVKQQLVRTFVDLADKAGVLLIAEGIETINELQILLDLGVELGQGYLFAYPAFPFPEMKEIDWPEQNKNKVKRPTY